MLKFADCRALAEQRLFQISAHCEADLVMFEKVVESGVIIAFFYQSDEYVKTSNSVAALAGNGPILVNRASGVVEVAGTALSLEEYVQDFEARMAS